MTIHRGTWSLALVPLLCAAGCSGGSPFDAGAAGAPRTLSSPTGFDVVSIVVANPAPLNGPIDVTFTQDVDFATVGPNTIRIRPVGDAVASTVPGGAAQVGADSAAGTYELLAPNLVRFRPACPTATADGGLAGAGLLPGQRYTIVLPGAAAGVQVRSTQGRALPGPRTARFSTPYAGALYADGAGGPPRVVVRDAGSSEPNATYLELGLEPANRVYFERNLVTNQIELPAGFEAPLNHRSRTDTRVAWMVELDQPIDPRPANLARVRLQYRDAASAWQWFPSMATGEANCSGAGALVRVTAEGLLPQGSAVRVLIENGFRDLVGEATAIDVSVLAAPVTTAFNPGTTTPGDDGDGFLESFADTALEDPNPLPLPRATWGGGALQASAGDNATGGPGGDFDWYLAAGTIVVIDTTFDTIIGGPGGAPTTQQTILNGVIDLRDMRVPATTTLVAIGPNPLTILATGSVDVQGRITVDGGDAPAVGTLNTTNQPEPGAPGRAGGGAGGVGSFLTSASTPAGGPGFGAFNGPGLGGAGGETSYAITGKNDRRGAGGGGARLGRDVTYTYGGSAVQCQTLLGMDAEPGFGGGPGGLGAISQSQRAQGGAVGPVPFVDGDGGNDFYGTLIAGSGALEGELAQPWPGAGGGAGGDAVNSATFPLVPFTTTGDEKGAGGGGGAGVLHILARGDITVGPQGVLSADGGNGSGGENTSFFDRVGGGSGGGSGGSIVLETSGRLIVDAVGNGALDYGDDPLATLHDARAIRALGGQGGAGNNNRGGANESGNTPWRCDAIPLDRLDRGAPGCDAGDVPPLGPNCTVCFVTLPDFDDPLGPVLGAGGDGGPGLLQFHVEDTQTDLFFNNITQGDLTQACAPRPIGWNGAWQGRLRPSVGTRSMNQSLWIALGQPRANPVGPEVPVTFFVDDLNSVGQVPQSGQGTVAPGPALFAPAAVVLAPAYPHITGDPFTMAFDSSTVSGFSDVYERNPQLLAGARLRLEENGNPQNRVDHVLASGVYDPQLDVLDLTVDGAAGDLASFAPAAGVLASVVPRTFEVETGGVIDGLSTFHRIEVSYDAAPAGPDGQPDLSASYSALNGGGWATDEQLLNAGTWDYVRFRVLFDVDFGGTGGGAQSAPPRVNFLRVPFRF
jgi:hypothetical protein